MSPVQRQAALRISPVSIPVQIRRGQTFTAKLTATNVGEAAVQSGGVTVAPGGSGGALLSIGPLPALALAGGHSSPVALPASRSQ